MALFVAEYEEKLSYLRDFLRDIHKLSSTSDVSQASYSQSEFKVIREACDFVIFAWKSGAVNLNGYLSNGNKSYESFQDIFSLPKKELDSKIIRFLAKKQYKEKKEHARELERLRVLEQEEFELEEKRRWEKEVESWIDRG
jgi:hypothetical protein